jgi:hypothetical protein
MMKLSCRTHILVKWTLDELDCIAHDGHLFLAGWLIAPLNQDRRGQNPALGPPGELALDLFRHCEQSSRNGGGGDTGRSVAP